MEKFAFDDPWGYLIENNNVPGAKAGMRVVCRKDYTELGVTIRTNDGKYHFARAFAIEKHALMPTHAVLRVLDMGVFVNGERHGRGERVLLSKGDRLELRARVGLQHGEIKQFGVGDTDRAEKLAIPATNAAWYFLPDPTHLYACELLRMACDLPMEEARRAPLDGCVPVPSSVSHAHVARWAGRDLPQLVPKSAPRPAKAKENTRPQKRPRPLSPVEEPLTQQGDGWRCKASCHRVFRLVD